MEAESARLAASREIVNFLQKYTEVIELQLVGVRAMIEESVETVMSGINDLSKETAEKAQSATATLEKTYLEPDAKTKDLVSFIQDSVDGLINEAQQNKDPSQMETSVLDNQMRRFGGKFSKHMEALSSIDQEVSQILYKMVSSLSTDDVIRQKLEHICDSVHALQVSLSSVLVNFEESYKLKEVRKMKEDLLGYTFKLYTAEDEKVIFKQFFKTPD
ncbi:MAG: hypothetical protein HRU09_08760 [Oligoflexales bacterium]|nr:hypothetical protein [Oligoflexales bacterium]